MAAHIPEHNGIGGIEYPQTPEEGPGKRGTLWVPKQSFSKEFAKLISTAPVQTIIQRVASLQHSYKQHRARTKLADDMRTYPEQFAPAFIKVPVSDIEGINPETTEYRTTKYYKGSEVINTRSSFTAGDLNNRGDNPIIHLKGPKHGTAADWETLKNKLYGGQNFEGLEDAIRSL